MATAKASPTLLIRTVAHFRQQAEWHSGSVAVTGMACACVEVCMCLCMYLCVCVFACLNRNYICKKLTITFVSNQLFPAWLLAKTFPVGPCHGKCSTYCYLQAHCHTHTPTPTVHAFSRSWLIIYASIIPFMITLPISPCLCTELDLVQ